MMLLINVPEASGNFLHILVALATARLNKLACVPLESASTKRRDQHVLVEAIGSRAKRSQCMEWGNIADVLSAGAALAGTVLSIFALSSARRANELVEKNQREAEQKEVARSIQAWWVHQHIDHKDTWGVVLQNHNPQSSVFYDVTVRTTGNTRNSDPIHVEVLPPGSFFVQSGEEWGWPQPIPNLTAFEPIMKSTKHRVLEVDFRDSLRYHYTWSPTSGLQIDPPPQ
ncbi:hypothetical protein [Kocuria rhizophila]|uniref:hypothetical protein n=1 Tax=Kocuria rhizophila TaxID=72000 RepID=UPI0021A2BA35|nr:hypothetical protein [Kocuria rhizophila]MCT2250132.1 hypothetical protein [Kocuria rhizophila]